MIKNKCNRNIVFNKSANIRTLIKYYANYLRRWNYFGSLTMIEVELKKPEEDKIGNIKRKKVKRLIKCESTTKKADFALMDIKFKNGFSLNT